MICHPHNQFATRSRLAGAVLTGFIAMTTSACESDDPDDKPSVDRDDRSSRSDGAKSDPLYLIASTFITGDDKETYLVTSPTFDESTKIDPTDGPKVLGGVDPVVRNQSAFVPAENGPVIVRYDLDDDDRLVKADELSFAGVGLTSITSTQIYAVSDTKAYVFDPAGARIIVWNPKTMTLAGKEIDLAEAGAKGWKPNLILEYMGPRRRGDQLIIPLSWQDQDGNSRVASGLVVVDSKNDELVATDVDERCGESMTSLEAPNGDIIFLPPAWSSTTHYFTEKKQPTCAPWIRAGETSFDDGDPLDLSALGSGSAVAGGIPDGESGFFFQAIDEALWDARESDLEGFWTTWHYDFETKKSREVTKLPPWIGQAYYADMGEENFIIYWEETSSGNRTTLYRVNGAGDPTKTFSFDASWYGFAKLR